MESGSDGVVLSGQSCGYQYVDISQDLTLPLQSMTGI